MLTLTCNGNPVGADGYVISRSDPSWGDQLGSLTVAGEPIEHLFAYVHRWRAEAVNVDNIANRIIDLVRLPHGQFDTLTITPAVSHQRAWWNFEFGTVMATNLETANIGLFVPNDPHKTIYEQALNNSILGLHSNLTQIAITGLCTELPAAVAQTLIDHDLSNTTALEEFTSATTRRGLGPHHAASIAAAVMRRSPHLPEVAVWLRATVDHLTATGVTFTPAQLGLFDALAGDWTGSATELIDTLLLLLPEPACP